MGRKRSVANPGQDLAVINEAAAPNGDLVHKLAAKMELLENQIKERDAKIDLLDRTQKTAGIGSESYGISLWKSWTSGSDQGYHRSLYVDIRTMAMPRAY